MPNNWGILLEGTRTEQIKIYLEAAGWYASRRIVYPLLEKRKIYKNGFNSIYFSCIIKININFSDIVILLFGKSDFNY